MTDDEWNASDDANQLLRTLWEMPHRDIAGLKRQLHGYYLACCRRIWKLLPSEDSRRGVEAGERYLCGQIDDDELDRINWHAEAVPYRIEGDIGSEVIARWVEEVGAIPASELREMLHPFGR